MPAATVLTLLRSSGIAPRRQCHNLNAKTRTTTDPFPRRDQRARNMLVPINTASALAVLSLATSCTPCCQAGAASTLVCGCIPRRLLPHAPSRPMLHSILCSARQQQACTIPRNPRPNPSTFWVPRGCGAQTVKRPCPRANRLRATAALLPSTQFHSSSTSPHPCRCRPNDFGLAYSHRPPFVVHSLAEHLLASHTSP